VAAALAAAPRLHPDVVTSQFLVRYGIKFGLGRLHLMNWQLRFSSDRVRISITEIKDQTLPIGRVYVMACYRDGMTKKTTTIRMPEELATSVEVVARGRGISVNTLVIDALTAEVERVRHDEEFMGKLREIIERDQEILDRLAQ
jgi:predicted HicB family RNase H-like nuclease